MSLRAAALAEASIGLSIGAILVLELVVVFLITSVLLLPKNMKNNNLSLGMFMLCTSSGFVML